MIGIIAVNNLGFIGKDNKLMWHSSEDLKHFKNIRQGRKMLVGYNTFEGLPSFLKDLVNHDEKLIVDQRDKLFLEPTDQNGELITEYLCIGGKKTYEKYCHMFTELHISHINDNDIGDCTLPDLKNMSDQCKIFNYHFEVNKPKEVFDLTIPPTDGHNWSKEEKELVESSAKELHSKRTPERIERNKQLGEKFKQEL